MELGAALFFTDYTMPAAALALALEERGYESVWAPEHSHIPTSRRSPFPPGGDLPREYAACMDPFVVLAVAGAVPRPGRGARGDPVEDSQRRHDPAGVGRVREIDS